MNKISKELSDEILQAEQLEKLVAVRKYLEEHIRFYEKSPIIFKELIYLSELIE